MTPEVANSFTDVRKLVAYLGPPDAARGFEKWKAANRDLMPLRPYQSFKDRHARLVERPLT